MKFQLLVPQYNETDSDIKPLLDSIAIQQNIDFKEIGIIICNDGSDIFLSDDLLHSYPFEITYLKNEHKGVSAARNACLDKASAEYVMFCDADDMFYTPCAFWLLFREMDTGFDGLISCFIEETRDKNSKQVVYVDHNQDMVFVHGKVWRRKYLSSLNIKFNPELTIHEDSYFNILARTCSMNVKYCPAPLYLWRWRDASVCRHDPDYILKTYSNMLKSNLALVEEFEKRNMPNEARMYTVMMIFDAYYTMNKPEWLNQDNKAYRDKTEKDFANYYMRRKAIWVNCSPEERMSISNSVRVRFVSEGMQMETITINDWLKHVEELI